jgi:hypothetical protein
VCTTNINTQNLIQEKIGYRLDFFLKHRRLKPYFDTYIKINTFTSVLFVHECKNKNKGISSNPNKNISFPIGSILAVQYFKKLNLSNVFSKRKSRDLDLNSLLIRLVSYKLTENISIKGAGK